MSTTATTPETIYSFGTSGYRNDTDTGFNQAVVTQITNAIADYLVVEAVKDGKAKPILVGGDTREKTKQAIPVIVEILKNRGIDVYQSEGDAPTPVLAYAAKYFAELNKGATETAGCILLTASHNPWPYGGYNFLTPDAAVAPTHVSTAFVDFQKSPKHVELDRARFGLPEQSTVGTFDPYPIYKKHLKDTIKINYKAIADSGLQIFYDPLYATGRNYFPRLLREEGINVTAIHDTDVRPADYKGMPEPSAENMADIKKLLLEAPASQLKIGFSTDGDADRFGVMDEKGNFIAPNDVLLLTLYHLIKNRKDTGAIVRSQASTHSLDALGKQYQLPVIQTPVGYKYIAEEFIEHENEKTQVLIGGEGSGGLSIKGHIPEKDGILANLVIAELVAMEKRPLSEILQSIKAGLPEKFVSRELSIKTPNGKAIIDAMKMLRDNGGSIGQEIVDKKASSAAVKALKSKYHTEDGVKIYLEEGSWILVRASGTEPLVRVYIETMGLSEAQSQAKNDALDKIMRDILAGHGVSAEQIKQKH